MKHLILASKSPYRKKQLRDLGLKFKSISPGVDEDPYKKTIKNPRILCKTLARLKSQEVAQKHPSYLVVGSDQLIHLKGKILGKPGTKQRALKQLMAMSNQTHELITSVCISYRGKKFEHTEIAQIRMRNLSRSEILSYIERDMPLDCAGSYKMELGGLTLVDSLSVKDPSSIVGLPLLALCRLIRRAIGEKKFENLFR